MHLLKNVKRDATANRKTQIMMILKSGTTAMAMRTRGKKPKFGKESTHGCEAEAASPSWRSYYDITIVEKITPVYTLIWYGFANILRPRKRGVRRSSLEVVATVFF